MFNTSSLAKDYTGHPLSSLQKTARTGDDLASWLHHNIGIFGITRSLDLKDIAIHLSYSFLDANTFYENDKPIFVPAECTIYIKDAPLPSSDGTKLLKIVELRPQAKQRSFKVELLLSDWAFLSADLAINLLENKYEIPKQDMAVLESMVDTFLPQHFPGTSWSTLKNLHSAGLLPIDGSSNLDEAAVREMLFITANKQPEILVPESLAP